jgi:hypothetical protein
VTVHRLLRRFPETGVAAQRRKPRGPPPNTAGRAQVETARGTLLDQDRTWTAAQLTAVLAEVDIRLSPRRTRKYLGRLAPWRRTVRTLRHEQDPAKVARATIVLTLLKKRRIPAVSSSCISTNADSPPVAGDLYVGTHEGTEVRLL